VYRLKKEFALNLMSLIISCQTQNKVSTILQLLQMGVISLKTKHYIHYILEGRAKNNFTISPSDSTGKTETNLQGA